MRAQDLYPIRERAVDGRSYCVARTCAPNQAFQGIIACLANDATRLPRARRSVATFARITSGCHIQTEG